MNYNSHVSALYFTCVLYTYVPIFLCIAHWTGVSVAGAATILVAIHRAHQDGLVAHAVVCIGPILNQIFGRLKME